MASPRPKVIGLTGGIASGKSQVAARWRQRGATVIDADQLARQVVEPGQPALADLVLAFGPEILRADGTLDRPALGQRVFHDDDARRTLARITHPRIALAADLAIAAAADAGHRVVIYEAALLVENRLHERLDGTVVVASAPATQLARLAARDGLSAADAQARLAAQLPLAAKLAVATWVIVNDGTRAELEAASDRVWAAIEASHGALAAH